MGDLNSFQVRYIALRHSMVEDGIRHKVPFHAKDLQTVLERLQLEGTSFVKVTLPKLGKALDQGLVSGRFTPVPHFRLKRNTRLPILCHQVFLDVFDSDGVLLPDPNLTSMRFLRQFLLFDAKLYFEPTPEMKEKAVDEFDQRMSSLRKKRIQTDHPILIRAKMLLGRVLNRLDISDIHPGHGPGAVAEKLDRFERWDFTSWPAKAERYYPFLSYGTQSFRAQMERGIAVPLRRETYTRCCLVPKDFKGPRLISAENTVNQYLQQGQMRAIMRYVEQHPLLKRSIRLQDQTYNQTAARDALQRGLVTLDLSNASDTVSVPLVWFLLSEVPHLRRRLMSTRSDYMLYGNRKIRITAFAPMGSATCFPVETLVFWAISMASVAFVRSVEKITAGGNATYNSSQSDAEIAHEVLAFGDDLIVPADALQTIISTLLEVGCIPNMSKTCEVTPFRESCGSEWFNGSDITITRNRRYQYESGKKLFNHPVLLDLQRKFFLQGFYSTAALLRDWAKEIFPVVELSITHIPDPHGILKERYRFNIDAARKSLWEPMCECVREPFSRMQGTLCSCFSKSQESLDVFERALLASDSFPFALGFDTVISDGCRIRYNRDYQRYECRVPREFQRSRNWQSGGYPRLLARLLSDQADRIAIRDRKIKMAWSHLPIPLGLSPF